MRLASIVFTLIVAAEHLYFLVLEMFLWTKPLGLKTFNNTLAIAETTKVLAMNQGLYNGFLTAGLVWAVLASDPLRSADLATFFLGCVIVAGAFGAATVSPRIFFVQAVPALIAIGLVTAAR